MSNGNVAHTPDEQPLSGTELESALAALVTDPDFRSLEYIIGRENFLGVLGRSFTERWHSAFLGWLLSEDSEHNLGTIPMQHFLMAIARAGARAGRSTIPVADLLGAQIVEVSSDLEFAVRLPDRNKTYFFDVFATGALVTGDVRKSFSVVVENKVKAEEREDQTIDYEACIAHLRRQAGEEAPVHDVRVFLIPMRDGDPITLPCSSSFVPFSYQQLYSEVIRPCLADPQLSDFGRALIKQYEANLRAPISLRKRAFPMAKIEDDAALVQKVLEKHRRVLDTIMLYDRGEVFNTPSTGSSKPKFVAGELGDLVQQGMLREGTSVVIRGREVRADAVVEVRGGVAGLVLNDKFYPSPSPAAAAVYGSSQNGWTAWRVLVEGEPGPTLADLRTKLRDTSPSESQ